MAALLDERAKVQNAKHNQDGVVYTSKNSGQAERSLTSLVESVKRKSRATEEPSLGKRRKM